MFRLSIPIVLGVAAVLATSLGGAQAEAPPRATYLALGDSLAVGVGASPLQDEHGYVGRFNHTFKDSRDGPHELVNVARNGETSRSLIVNGQLAAAQAAIADTDSDIQVVTLDIGGNDLQRLLVPGQPCAADPNSLACAEAVGATLGSFATNYTAILYSLVASLTADPGQERVMVITYYNPFSGTGNPFEGPVDKVLVGMDGGIDCTALPNPARRADVGMNDLIACIGAAFGATTVDIYPIFDGNGPALTHIAEGDVHPNNDGHRAIADALAAALT